MKINTHISMRKLHIATIRDGEEARHVIGISFDLMDGNYTKHLRNHIFSYIDRKQYTATEYEQLTDTILQIVKEEEEDATTGMKWRTQDRETGTIIDEFNTLQEARLAVEDYEQEDKDDGNYTPNFYEIIYKETYGPY